MGGVPGVLAWAKLLVPAGAGRPSELEFCAAASGKAAFHGSTMPRHLGLTFRAQPDPRGHPKSVVSLPRVTNQTL